MTTKVLAFDTALNGCAIAVWDSATGQAATRVFETGREQAAKLIPLIQEAMNEAGVTFADLGLIVTTIGPGSFTGLRIGLSTARSFSLALKVPVQGVTTFDAMHATCKPEGPSLIVLESKRTDFYVQAYDAAGKALEEPGCMLADEIADRPESVLCGDGLLRLEAEGGTQGRQTVIKTMIDPVGLAERGFKAFQDSNGAVNTPVPLYLRGADVSVSNKVSRKIRDFTSL
jgi:tRNA threonylcarbamoyladenosine biosynthesis protein TsaB